jgi:hypothetical protein
MRLIKNSIGTAGTENAEILRLLDGAHSEAGDKSIHEKVIEDGDRNAGDKAAGHERTPEVYIAVNQESGDANAHSHVPH